MISTLMLTLVAALLRKFTRKVKMPEVRERIVGRVLIDDEAQIPLARAELIKKSFEAAGREPDDRFIYDFYYNPDLDIFEMVVMIDVDG